MQTTRHTTLFTHPQTTDHPLPPTDDGPFFTLPQITPITLIKLCVSARGYGPQITPITLIKLCDSAREALTADYTDYTDKLCGSARETLTADYTDYTDKLCGSARGYCPQITPITLIILCGSARETLTADYTDYTDKLCELFSPSRKEPLRLCARNINRRLH